MTDLPNLSDTARTEIARIRAQLAATRRAQGIDMPTDTRKTGRHKRDDQRLTDVRKRADQWRQK